MKPYAEAIPIKFAEITLCCHDGHYLIPYSQTQSTITVCVESHPPRCFLFQYKPAAACSHSALEMNCHDFLMPLSFDEEPDFDVDCCLAALHCPLDTCTDLFAQLPPSNNTICLPPSSSSSEHTSKRPRLLHPPELENDLACIQCIQISK